MAELPVIFSDTLPDRKTERRADARLRRRAVEWALNDLEKARADGGKITASELLQEGMFRVAKDAVTAENPRDRARALDVVASIKLRAAEALRKEDESENPLAPTVIVNNQVNVAAIPRLSDAELEEIVRRKNP